MRRIRSREIINIPFKSLTSACRWKTDEAFTAHPGLGMKMNLTDRREFGDIIFLSSLCASELQRNKH